MEKKELIENLGANFTMCFLDGCPRADKCVRHLAYEMIGGEKSYGSTVMPSSLKDGQCSMFFEAKVLRYAKGASHLYDEVRMKHYETIKVKVMGILGGRTSYYRCLRGEKLISEEKQKAIASLFESYGYESDNLFDEYVNSF